MAKGKSSKPAPSKKAEPNAQKLRQQAAELRARGRLLEARADILDAKNPPKNGPRYGY
jgi:hypothetical protein